MSNSFRLTEEQYAAIVARQVKHSEAPAIQVAQSKYKNIKTTVNGETFDSKKEAAHHQTLVLREQAGEISDLCRQTRFKLGINGVDLGWYVADWTYMENGKCIVADAKGYKTPVYKLKKKLMKALYDVEILEP